MSVLLNSREMRIRSRSLLLEESVDDDAVSFSSATELEKRLIKSIVEDDKPGLLAVSRRLQGTIDRPVVSKLLHLCCAFDSADCAAVLLNGDFGGAVPLVNDFDEGSKLSHLHASAHELSSRCVELLLKKHARTDLKSRDGRFLIPLELSLLSSRVDVIWSPENDSIEDLVRQLGQKDLTTVKLLSEKTTTLDEVAYASAIGGRVLDLAILLLVASEKLIKAVLELHDADLEIKVKTTIYDCIIREALALGRSKTTPPRAAKRSSAPTKGEIAERRKLLLCEIELLQLFEAAATTGSTDKKVLSPLIRAAQAGDEAVIELLLKTNTDINDVDADGNSALHWCLKTSKGSCPHQIKIMLLLLTHGARVSQKNKLGLTAAHIAAANGNLEGLKIILLEDPNCANSRSEIKETPLFFAVKNDFKDCTELLLRSGASTEVLNLRRQRPIDLAVSQDMRFLLNPTNISLTNLAFPVKERYTVLLQGDEVISETRKELLPLTDEGNDTDRTCSKTETEVCKYFESSTGCFRGSKCFYLHIEEKHQKMKQGKDKIHSPAIRDLQRKVFVGGLPINLDSDSLRSIFEEQFGLVDDAIIIGAQTGDEIQSRGFGFITFKDKRSVSAAVESHYVTIMGKKVEIKSAVPKCVLQSEHQKSLRKHDLEETEKHLPEAETPQGKATKEMSSWKNPEAKTEMEMLGQWMHKDKTRKEMPCCRANDECKTELMPWADTLICGHPTAFSKEPQKHDETMPPWLRTFKKWFPRFLQQRSKKEGDYALSSLKADFKAAFGLELDHASLGFPKLSDFMRSFPDLCDLKSVPVDQRKPANHVILVPRHPKIQESLQKLIVEGPASHVTSINGSCNGDLDSSLCLKDLPLSSNEDHESTGRSPTVSQEIWFENAGDTAPSVDSRFLQFLKPDPIFHTRTWLHRESDRGRGDIVDEKGTRQELDALQPWPQERHLVLEALSRDNSSVFFMREFDFYMKYKANIMQGKCSRCNCHQVLWANFPCLHLLWCTDCKVQAMKADCSFGHKCVVCDMRVQRIIMIPWDKYCQTKRETAHLDDYQSFDPCYIQNLSREKEQLYMVKV